MFTPPSDAFKATASAAVVVDLIGDLDATLGTLVAETIARIATNGTDTIFVTTKHVALSSPDGLAALRAGVTNARDAGVAITLEAGNRKMRAALATARIATAIDAARPMHARHFMLAHHAPAPRSKRRELALSA